jgi:phosphopentomutase
MLIAGPRVRIARPLGTRSTFSDLGVSVCDYLGISSSGFPGKSALGEAGLKC